MKTILLNFIVFLSIPVVLCSYTQTFKLEDKVKEIETFINNCDFDTMVENNDTSVPKAYSGVMAIAGVYFSNEDLELPFDELEDVSNNGNDYIMTADLP